jgi:class 3 adenylate cyclase
MIPGRSQTPSFRGKGDPWATSASGAIGAGLEDMRQVIRAYQDPSSGVVARYDGFVAKFMGDGILAYFGFPRAHEDDAERPVRAGLASFCRIGRWDQRKNLI